MSPNTAEDFTSYGNVGDAIRDLSGGAPKTEGGGFDDAFKKNDAVRAEAPPVPNSKLETDSGEENGAYVYRDFATVPAPSLMGTALHPQSLQAQKLPAKLSSILSDQELTSVIVWMPHGRSWKVLNRDLFAEHALPRYFGHNNYASFVRIVNAWGFRRITRGPDRDAYYHELFLRGRSDLYQRMKRLSACHRKTPVNKEDKCPNFYELAKTSPLPDINLPGAGGHSETHQLGSALNESAMGQLSAYSSLPRANQISSIGSLGGPMGNVNDQMLSRLLTKDPIHQSLPNNSQALPRLVQLQRDNEDLRRRIMAMESKQAQGGNQSGGMTHQHSMVPDQFSSLSNPTTNGGGNGMLERELERMQRDFMMQHSNNPMNNSMTSSMNNPVNNSMNNSLLSSLGGSSNGSGSNSARNEFSFMSNFPRDNMLLAAMRLDNQMGFLQQPASSAPSTLERALQQNNSGSSSTPDAAIAGGTPGSQDDRRKAMMEWMAKHKQGGSSPSSGMNV